MRTGPVAGEVFSGPRSGGATADGSRLHRQSSRTELGACVVSTGFAGRAAERRRQVAIIDALPVEVRHLRVLRAASYERCQLARGRIDGYVETSLAEWDVLPGVTIAREAGCTVEVRDESHGQFSVLGARPSVFPALKRTVAPILAMGAA